MGVKIMRDPVIQEQQLRSV